MAAAKMAANYIAEKFREIQLFSEVSVRYYMKETLELISNALIVVFLIYFRLILS